MGFPFSDGDVDVQPIRSPAVLNTAYQEVMLWNGQFGAIGVNAGTEACWTKRTPKETNYLGYAGLETQAIAGLDVHHMGLVKDMAQQLGYDQLFDPAFPATPDSLRYGTVTAGLAIAAYQRNLLASRSPWQRYLRGREAALN